MQIPRYWAEASAPAQNRYRHRVTVRRFGWSDDSAAAAQAHADQRLQEALAHMRQPDAPRARENRPRGYNGADGLPICEEVLDTRGSAVLTRNSYGAQCINTPDVLFADVDVGPSSANPARGKLLGAWVVMAALLAWALSRSPEVTLICALLCGLLALWLMRRSSPARRRQRALERIRRFARQHPDWGLRVYETPAGFRVLVTHRTFAPSAPEVQALFDALEVDPLYRRMSLAQQCFRARVSAKPWRMGISTSMAPNARIKWPVPPGRAAARATWVATYEQAAQQYAACRLVESLGTPAVALNVRPVLDWHDELSRARSSLPLA